MSSKKSNVYHPVPPRAILSSRSMRASARSPRNLSVRDDSVNQDQIGEVISSQGQVLRRSMKESREMYPVKRPLILESTATRNMKLALDRNIDIINHYRLSETAHVGVFARNTEEYLTNNVTDHDHLLPSPILKSPVNAEQISKQNHQIEYQNTMAWSAIAEYMSSNSNEKNNDYAKILKHPKSQTQSATSDTTIYQSLDLFQTLYKLEKLKNDGKIGFFHVTPRFNVKICNKCDFYDLVVVEEPGSNKTGLVWGKSSLSVPREGEEGSDFIPLSTLLKERQEAMFLRKKIFFGKFQELKHFQGWKLIMLWNRRRRIMERLADCALVTDERFVTAILTVRNLTYEIESETQLFCFQKSGSIPILTFFTAQTKKIDECKVIIREKVLNIREAIKIQYEKQIEESSLREKAYEIFKNHPFANKKYVSETNTNNNNNHKGKVSQIIRKKDQLEDSHLHRTATTVNVTMTSPSPSPILLEGWSDIRAIQRLKDNALDKANRVFLLAQYMLNVSIAHLLEDLWARLNQMIIGVRRVLITNSIIHSNTTNNSNNMTVDTAIHDDVNYTTSLSQSLPLPSSSSGIHRWDLIDVLNQDMYSDIIQTKVKPSPRKSQLSSPVKPSPLQLQLTTAAATAILSPQQQSPNNTQQNQQQSYSQEAITEGSSLQNKADFSSAQWESIGVPLHWQYEGVHLCVEVALCEEDEQKLVIDFNRNNLSIRANAVRLKVIPTLFDISKAISSLLNALGNLLEALPSLKGYSFSGMDYTSKNIEDTSNVEVEVEEQIDNGGNKYMIQLAKYSSVANQLAYQRAISCTQQLRLAYSQASMPSIAMKDLYEIFKSLWEMDEEIICEQIEKKSLSQLSELLRKMKIFETNRFAFEAEITILDTIFNLISPKSSEEEGVPLADIAVAEAFMGEATILQPSPSAVRKLFMDSKDRLLGAAGKCRLFLMRLLYKMKEDISAQRVELHSTIKQESRVLQDSKYSIWNESPSGMCASLDTFGHHIVLLREKVRALIRSQYLLSEAHDLLGCANAILDHLDIDVFTDMESLEDNFQRNNMKWTAVNEVVTINQKLLASKLGGNIIGSLWQALRSPETICEYLAKLNMKGDVVSKLFKYIQELQPTLETVSFLTSNSHRPRHWKILDEKIFRHCGLKLKQTGDNLLAIDVRGAKPVVIGGLYSIAVSNIIHRGVSDFIEELRAVTVSAYIEEIFENTLNAVDRALSSANVNLSQDWLQDRRMREKIFFDLHRVTNCTQLSALLQYTLKTVLTVEMYAANLGVHIFEKRTTLMRDQIIKMEKFISSLYDIQTLWMRVFRFVKFSLSGDLDRDTSRSLQTCTEDMKKIELILQSTGGFQTSFDKITSLEINTTHLQTTLLSIYEDYHVSIQSLLDTAPRLSLLSYDKLCLLVNLWLIDPCQHISFISSCFHEMFEGVGTLLLNEIIVLKQRSCIGFLSSDNIEIIKFLEIIPFQLPLDDFIKRFELQLRNIVSTGCDDLEAIRIIFYRSILSNATREQVAATSKELYNQRMNLLTTTIQQQEQQDITYLNLSFYLVYMSCFVEDVWLALGYLIGTYAIARPDLQGLSQSTSKDWVRCIRDLSVICKANETYFQSKLSNWNKSTSKYDTSSDKLKANKYLALYTALYLQERIHINIIESIASCKNLKSAQELWTGRLHLRYIYSIEERTKNSPFDVTIGSLSIPYGLEYCGGHIRISSGINLDRAIQKTLSATLANRGAIYSSFQLFLSTLSLITTAIDSKDDYFLVGALKFPLNTKTNRTALQLSRRKANVAELRQQMDLMTKCYNGIILVGITDDIYMEDTVVLENIVRSIFDVTIVESKLPFEGLDDSLTIASYRNGAFLKKLSIKFVEVLSSRKIPFSQIIGSKSVHTLVSRASNLLRIFKGMKYIKSVLKRVNKVERDKQEQEILIQETECFVAIFWEFIVRSDYNDLSSIRNAFSNVIQTCLIEQHQQQHQQQHQHQHQQHHHHYASTEHHRSSGGVAIGDSQFPFRHSDRIALQMATDMLNFEMDGSFEKHAMDLWYSVTDHQSRVIVINGSTASGKTSIRRAVSVGLSIAHDHNNNHRLNNNNNNNSTTKGRCSLDFCVGLGFSKYAFAALVIARTLQKWHSYRTSYNGSSSRKQKNKSELMSSTTPKVNSYAYISDKFDKQRDVYKISNMSRTTTATSSTHINETVIYHSSLSFQELLGFFDSNGFWFDGILARWVRRYGCNSPSLTTKPTTAPTSTAVAAVTAVTNSDDNINNNNNASSNNDAKKYILVLDGTISASLEQMFCSSLFRSTNSTPFPNENRAKNIGCHSMSFPSGETFPLDENTSIIIESSSLSAASPGFIAQISILNITSDAMTCLQSLIYTWKRNNLFQLDHFTIWKKSLEFLYIILTSSFLKEILLGDPSYKSKNSNEDHSLAHTTSRVGSFLRILGEWLVVSHQMSIKENAHIHSFHRDKNNSSTTTATTANATTTTTNTKTTTSNDSASSEHEDLISMVEIEKRSSERLLVRVEMAVVHAAVWGFGGPSNGSDRRVFFEVLLRQAVKVHIPEISLPNEFSLFEAELLLEDFSFRRLAGPRSIHHSHHFSTTTTSSQSASENARNPLSHQQREPSSLDLSKAKLAAASSSSAQTQNQWQTAPDIIDSTLVSSSSSSSSSCSHKDGMGQLQFNSGRGRAVLLALKQSIKSGANVLFLGSKGTERDTIISEVLTDCSRNCMSSFATRSDISNSLIDLILNKNAHSSTTSGIAGVLKTLQDGLIKLKNSPYIHDNDTDFATYWKMAQSEIMAQQRPVREAMDHGMIFAVKTSLKTMSSANDMRQWIQKQLRSENLSVLDAPHHLYTTIFIEDLHIASIDYSSNSSRNDRKDAQKENCSEEFLRGILQGTSSYDINILNESQRIEKKVLNIWKNIDDKWSPKRLRFIYENLVKPPPIIHRASYSDPKRPILQPDNFLIRQLGLFSTSTLEYTQLLQCANLERIIQYMSIISLPQLTTQDLHLSLINGIQTCLHESPLNKLYDIKSELKELAQYTLNIFKGTSLLIDDNSYSKIEHSCSHLIHLNYDTINKFCIPLSMASNSVNTLSALLQECGHEWKRLFFDCIPSGPMRDRITQIIRAQFDFIDVKKWGVSNLWLKSLASDLSSPYGSVWLDVTRLKNNTATTSTTGNFSITPQKVNVAGHGTFSYIPLEADIDSNESFIDNTMTSTIDNNNAMPYYNLNATTFNNPTSYNMNYSNNNINSHNQSNNNGDDIHIDPPGGWNISSVLYPCALSHILRLMRVLCMQSTSPSSSPSSSSSSSSTATTKTPNILLAGLTGAPLTPAIQLAAKLCGIEVCFYNAITMDDLAVMTSTSSSSTIDTESAFQSKYAADFTSFLKRCIFRACGLKRSESGYNAVESRKNEVFDSDGYMNIHDYPISFEMNPPQRILIAINGYQHLDESSIAVNLAKISSMSKDTHEHTNNRSHINTKGNNTDNDNGVGMGKVNKVNFHDDNISNNSNGDNSEDDDEDDDEHVEDSSLTGRGKGNVEGDDDNEDQSQSQTASGSGSGSGSVSLQESHSCSSNSVLSDNHNQSQTMTTTMTGAVKRGSQTSGSSRALNSVRDRYGDRGIGRGRDSLLDTAGGGGGGMEYHLDEDNEEDDDDEDSSFDSSEGSYSTDAYEFIRPLNILQCANYHIVKSFLANLVASNLSLALIAHFPCSQRLRETIDINNNAAGKSNNNTAPNSAEDMFDEDDHLLDESEDIDNNNTNAASATATRRDIKDAFTLLRATSKHSSVENATSTSTSATTTEGEEEGEEEEKPKSNILGCPILSDFICRRFAVIWWAVSATDAISGISSFQLNPLTMKESKTNAIITFIKRDVGFHSAEELSTAAAVVVNTDLTVNSFIKFRIQSNCNAIYKYLSGIKQFGVFNALGRDLFASSENKGGLIVGGVVGVTSPGNGNANGNGFGFGFGQSEGLTFHPYDPTAPPVFFTENISKNTNDNQRIIEEMLTALLLDAGNLLPLLLTTSTCVDKVLFSARIILPNAERMAEIACEIVSGVIDVGARGILTRREVLLRAQKVLEEAMDVIKILNTSSLGAMNKNLRHLTSAISYSHDEIRQLETENELYNICITRTIEYERILLLQEEIYSYEISLKNAENKQNEIVEFHHRRLQRVTVRQWQTWAAIFSTQPPQEYIELMRAVLLLVNFSNIKIVQNSSDIQQEIDEAGIKRSAMSILSSADFINKLLDVDVKELNKIKMESLISINKILYTTKEFGRISYDKDGELLDKPKYNENDALYHMLREYFEALESCQNLDEDIAHIAHIIAEKKYLLKVYQMEDFSRIRYTNESYTRKKDILMERSSILQNELRFLQMKVDRIAIIAKNPENYINMISGSLDFVNREIYQMESVLRTLVGDICIAAVVFVRAGWAPEHIRQLVMKQIRDETIRLKHFVTDGPFVLGGLWDQIQMRRWTHSNEGSIPRDICSLNAMCLLYIIPRIAFVIDPQCIAEEAIVDAMSGDYVVYTTKASQFSLVQLEEWIHGSPHREKSHNKTGKRNEFLNTSKATNITSAIIITDIQAGVNEDLITFLSSEFVTSGGAAGGGSGRGGVSVRFSPLGSTYKDTLSLHQLRIILLSTKAPTVDGNGFTSPLPSSCFLNVQLLHWTGSNAHTYFIDPNPFDTALNKTPVADSSMESHMSSMLFSRCLQEMTSKIRTTADRICSGSIDLTTAEERAIITLLSSAKDRLEEEKRFRMLQIPKEVEALHFVYVSFLEDDSCWEVLKGTSETRTALSSGIASLMEFERDRLLYQSIVGELFSLPAEFIRMCDVIIQKEDFPPYALTAKSICYQCLRPLLSSKTVEKIIKTFPHSMMDTLRIVEAVSFIQEWYRKIQIKIKSTRKPDVFELKSSSSHNLLMKRLSITSNININNSSSNNIHERKDSFISIESDLKNNINSAIETNSNSNNINITERRSSLSKQGSFSRISSFSRRESFTKGSFSKGSFSKGSFIKGSFIKGNNSSFISQGSYSSSRYGLDLSKKGLKVTTSTLDLKDFEIQGIDHALCLYIHPLRSIILNSIIKYILKHVHAKSEWLVKLSLWLVTLSKTAVIPMEELKALLELIRMKFGHKRIIYSYHISLQQTLIMTNRRTMGGSFNNNCSSSSSSFNLITRSSSNNLDYLKRKHEFLFNASRKQKPIDKKDNIGFNINVRGPAEFNGVLIHSSSTFWNIAGDDSLDINVKTLYRWKPFFDNRGKLRLEQISNPKIDYIQNSFLQGKFEIEWLSLLGVKAISITNAISNTAVIATAPTGTGGGGGGGGGSVIMTGGIPLSLRAASFVGRKLSVMIDPKEIMNNLAARASPEKKLSIISSSSNALQSSGGTASGSSTGGSTVPDANSWRGLRRTSVSNGPSAIPTAGLALGGRRMSFLNPNAATASLIPVVVEDISLSFLTRLDPLSASLQGLIKANYPKDIIKESAMKIPQLLDSYHVKRNLRILEKHSCLSSIYLGMRILIMSYKSNFMQWLLVVDSLLDALTNELTQQDLLFLIAQVRPPVPVPLDDPEKRATMGSWAAGNEPTVLQTLLFTAAVTPDAVIPMIELFFHATKEFLQMGGTIASYDDELCDEDEQPYDTVINGNNSNSNNSLSGDMFNSTSTPIAQTSTLTSSSFVRTRNRGIGNMAWTGMDMDQIKELSSHEEDDEEENDDSESESESESGSESDSRSISSKSYYSNSGKGNKSTPRFKNMNLPLFGIDLSLFTNQKRKAILADALIANSWKHLRRIISGITPPNVPRYSTVKPKYRIMLRNHENWEESLLFIFSEQFSYEKYIPIKFLNEKDDLKALFLSAHINNNNTNDTTGSNNNNFNFQRLIMEDITKRVKIQILATTAPASKKKIIIEMVDITSGLGNSILSSVSSQLLRKQTDRNTNENKQLLQNNSINMNQEGNSIMFAILNSSKSISGAGRSADRTIIKMTNSWLPRYSIPDVICTVNDWSLTNNSSFASTVHIHRHITLYEAKGMLLQELEESLLVICSAIRQQLQTTPKGVLETNPLSTLPLIALKTAAAILVLRRIVMYLNCKLRENKHHPAMWSRCLVMPNQWELARITMKCLDILKSDWQSRLVSATLTSVIKKIPMNKTTQDMPHHPMTEAYSLLPLPRDRVFIRLVCQCCETFMTVRGQREQEMEKAKDERDSRRKDGEDGSRSRTGMSNQSSRASLASTTASVTGRSSINNFSTNIKSSSNTESGGGVGMGSSFYKSGMSFSKTSKPSPSSIHDHQEIRLGGGASFKVGASFLAANKSSSNQYQPGVVVKSTYARQGRQPTRTSKAARAQALAVEQAAEELEELTLASGGKRVRDRFISISMLLFSNLLSVSNDDTTATTTTAAAASVVTTGNPILEGLQSYRSEADDMLKNIEEDLDEVNEVWPSFRAELCNIRIGGLSMDIIMSIMKEWISSV
eukprot:gene319-578_t